MDRKKNSGFIFSKLVDLFKVSESDDTGIKIVACDLENDVSVKRAQKLKDKGNIVLGIGILPFFAVGEKSLMMALQRAENLARIADGCFLINKEAIRSKKSISSLLFQEQLLAVEAEVDKIVLNIETGLSDILLSGYINIDSSVIKDALQDCGTFKVIRGSGEGSDRMEMALKEAFDQALSERIDINTAHKLIIKGLISEDKELKMEELGEFQEFISTLPNNVEVIFGFSNCKIDKAELEIVMLVIGAEPILREV
ncbi:MAG: hypothetical protein HDS62_08655 [Bacteroidales bacterium]|nr:hypothetical protein [Bacteroidales bacterium]